MQEILLKIKYFERELSKSLKTFFVPNLVPFHKQSYQKQKGPGTSDQSHFRLRNKFIKFPLFVLYYLTKSPLNNFLKHVQNMSPNNNTDAKQLLLILPNCCLRLFLLELLPKKMLSIKLIFCYYIFIILDMQYIYSPAFLLFKLCLQIYMKFSHSVSRELIILVYKKLL